MKNQWLCVLFGVALGLSLCSCTQQGDDVAASLSFSAPQEAISYPEVQVEEKSVSFDGVLYTLLEVNSDYVSTGKYATPKPGYHFITVKLRYQNQSETEIEASSLLMMSVTDENGTEYPITITVSDLPQTLDGVIAPGDCLEGYAAFEIPQKTVHLTLSIQPNLFADDGVRFVLF